MPPTSRRRERLSSTLPALAALAGLACSSSSYADGPARPQGGDFRWQKALDAPTRLEVSDLNGRIRLESAPGDTLVIVAVKTGRPEDLARVSVVAREEGRAVIACALWPGQSTCAPGRGSGAGDGVDVRVDFVVHVPARVSSVSATTLNGGLSAKELGCAATLRTLNGAIEVTSRAPVDAETLNGDVVARVAAKGQPVRRVTKSGRVELALPGDVDADVAMSTFRGAIGSDFGAVAPPSLPGVPRTARFRLGSGGTRVALETLNGDVLLRRAPDKSM